MQWPRLKESKPLFLYDLPTEREASSSRESEGEENMALQWAILASLVSVEAAMAIILTLPLPRLLKSPVVALASLLLKPSAGVLPFAVLHLMELYWKKEHFLICVSEVCTASERDRYEKSIYKAQRNVVLCILACLLYWCIYIICKFHKAVQELEEDEKRHKNQ